MAQTSYVKTVFFAHYKAVPLVLKNGAAAAAHKNGAAVTITIINHVRLAYRGTFDGLAVTITIINAIRLAHSGIFDGLADRGCIAAVAVAQVHGRRVHAEATGQVYTWPSAIWLLLRSML